MLDEDVFYFFKKLAYIDFCYRNQLNPLVITLNEESRIWWNLS